MIEGLRPYLESGAVKPMARTSGINIPWLTVIPEHWKISRAKGLFSPRTERARPDDEQLSATQAFGVIPQKEFERRVGRKVVQITQHLDKRAHVEPDDFVISMRSFQGGLERAWARGCIRSSYVVLKPSRETHVGYFAHLFKSLDYIRALQATGNFIRDGQDLNFHNFSLVDLPLPPLTEQAAIARCLDHANGKIDRFIRAKRKLIGLLNEQKQAIIHRAVTRGLNPNAPLKPSGVPWLGEIPRHWEIIRSGNLFREVVDIGHPDATLLSIDRFKGVIPQADTGRRTRASKDRTAYKRVRPGQLAYNLMNAFMGALGFSEYDGIVSPAYAVARPLREIETRYYHHLLRTSAYTGEYNRQSYGIMYERNRLYFERFRLVPAIFPPPEEQRRIADWIEAETCGLNIAIARTEREIALMQEYRTRLTADVVTGKLDVREAAARLPEPQGEPLSSDEIDPSSDLLEDSEPDSSEEG